MGSVREEIAELGIETTSYEGQGISMHLSKKDIKQILSLVCKRIEGAGLKPKEAFRAYTEGKKKWLNSKDSYKYDDETYAFLNIAQTQLQHCVDVIKEE